MAGSSFKRISRLALVGAALMAILAVGGCGSAEGKVVVQSLEDTQIISKAEYEKLSSADAGAEEASTNSGTEDTVPQNEDDRPVEERILEAFTKFKACIEDSGETIRGNLQDRNNPAFQDPDYVKVLSKCAARTRIAEIFQEFQEVRANLTPEQVRERNESFKKLQPCLEKKGWTIETSISDIGLIEPTTFSDPDGGINTRDIDQCASELGIDASDFSE